MTPNQREAALRLADYLEADKWYEAAALLRELASEPQGEPVATLHDDGYWTPKQTEAGRRLNGQLMRAGSRVDVYAHPPQRKPLVDDVIRPLIDDTSEVFDASGSETPQVVRDVIEYVQSWLEVYFDKRGIGEAP